jgi:hypothetical protein
MRNLFGPARWAIPSVLLMSLLISCNKDEPIEPPTPPPGAPKTVSCKLPKAIKENSGMALSPTSKRWYVIQDSDNDPVVHVFDEACGPLGIIKVQGTNVDWEAIAWHGGKLYIGDIGDNEDDREHVVIYSFKEPEDPNAKIIPHWENVRYSTGPVNAEGLDLNSAGDLFIADKNYDQKKHRLFKVKDGVATPFLGLQVKEAIGDVGISPSGDKLIFTTPEIPGQVLVGDWAGNYQAVKVPEQGQVEAVEWITDTKFAVASEEEQELYVIDLAPAPAPEPTPVPSPTEPPVAGQWWRPPPLLKFQILDRDDGDFAKQVKPGTQVVTIESIPDEDEGEAAGYGRLKLAVDALHAKNVKVICYKSASKEPWRADADRYPKAATGKKMKGWNEWWPDWRPNSLIHPFLDHRDLELAKAGCDCTEDDNMVDKNDNESGFPLSHEEAVASVKRRTDHAHANGMCYVAKNNPSMSAAYAQIVDAVFIEEAGKYNERKAYDPYREAGKFGAMIEYSSSGCKPYAGFSVQYHPGGDYFDGVNFKNCP